MAMSRSLWAISAGSRWRGLRVRFSIPTIISARSENCKLMTARTKRSLLIGAILIGGLSVFALLTGRPGDAGGAIVGAVVGGTAMTVAIIPEWLMRRRRRQNQN
jgi:hypothetical protein